MKIGSFFLILLVALVALGYLLSDSFHLREDISNQQKEIKQLTQTVQQTEQEKQYALTALQTANQNLQSCQQQVEQSNQTISQITNENSSLREQNRLLATLTQLPNTTGSSAQLQTQTVQSTALSLIVFIALGFTSMAIMRLKSLQKQPLIGKQHAAKTGNYVYLTNAEISELIQRRRNTTKFNASNI